MVLAPSLLENRTARPALTPHGLTWDPPQYPAMSQFRGARARGEYDLDNPKFGPALKRKSEALDVCGSRFDP